MAGDFGGETADLVLLSGSKWPGASEWRRGASPAYCRTAESQTPNYLQRIDVWRNGTDRVGKTADGETGRTGTTKGEARPEKREEKRKGKKKGI